MTKYWANDINDYENILIKKASGGIQCKNYKLELGGGCSADRTAFVPLLLLLRDRP